MSNTEKILLAIQVLSTLIIAATFAVYFLQLKAMRSASTAQNILALVNFLQAVEVREARLEVRTTLKQKELKLWDKEDERRASLVCATYDLAAILMRSGLVPTEVFIQNWAASIKDCHDVCEPFIRRMQRLPENSNMGYWDNFDWLYEQVLSTHPTPSA